MDAIYRIDGNRVVTSPHAAGPWNPHMQHGSAPSALVTWLAEQLPTASPMAVTRVTIDLMRPVPVAPLTYEIEVLREGRKIQLVGIRLFSNGTLVTNATVLKMRIEPQTLPAGIKDAPVTVPLPDAPGLTEPNDHSSAFVTGVSIRVVHGGFRKLGPGAIWYRANRAIVEGQPISQAMRAVIASDFSNGSSSVLNFKDWMFMNADLTVSLARQPVGEWVLLDSETWIGPDGAGLAASKLADVNGYFGRAVQSLVIERR
jgi:Thioesterase-like superfamily